MKNYFVYFCFLFCTFCIFHANAQNNNLQLKGLPQDIQTWNANASKAPSFTDEIIANNYIKDNIIKLRNLGYITANVDTFWVQDKMLHAQIIVGEKHKWAKISNGNVPDMMLNNIGFDEKLFYNKPLDFKKLASVSEKLLRYAENNGYPFASVFLDSIKITDNSVEGKLMMTKNYFITIDSIDVQGDSILNVKFLQQYLGIKQGDMYNESLIKKISGKIKELPFIQEERPWQMYFNVSQTMLTLFIKNKVANKADVLVGLLPNSTGNGGKFLLTGDIKLALVNSLHNGESISLNWQNLQYKSPRLNIEMNYPYLLGTPFGIIGKFDYYKKDSSYRTVAGELGLQYKLNASNYLKIYYNTNTSRLLQVDTVSLKLSQKLPANLDIASKTIGEESYFNHTDYMLNATKGYQVLLNGSIATRTIIKNNTIENTYDNIAGKNFSYLYDTIATKTYKYSFHSNLAYYVKTSKRSAVKIAYNGGVIFNKNLFKNELFQIGGYRLLRGFDEASLFVNNYNIGTIEPKYLLNKNSYFFLFTDAGTLQSTYINNNKINFALGIGAGITFETKGGVFNFVYAIGNNLGTGLQTKNSKIHFGYINTF